MTSPAADPRWKFAPSAGGCHERQPRTVQIFRAPGQGGDRHRLDAGPGLAIAEALIAAGCRVVIATDFAAQMLSNKAVMERRLSMPPPPSARHRARGGRRRPVLGRTGAQIRNRTQSGSRCRHHDQRWQLIAEAKCRLMMLPAQPRTRLTNLDAIHVDYALRRSAPLTIAPGPRTVAL